MTERKASGLYDPAFERDSCGFGLIANLDDMPSHWVVETAISALARLTHRGAVAADGKTGDGCGLLIKFPRAFLRAVGEELGFVISERFAAGTVFLSQDDKAAAAARAEIDRAVAEIGLEVAGWREVPTDPSVCGEQALETLPRIEQLYVNAPAGMSRGRFNRRLFLARRRAEKRLGNDDTYFASLSSVTISYKGMIMPAALPEFYPDLRDPRLESSVCHVTAVAPRTAVSLSRPQRGNQHDPGKPELGTGQGQELLVRQARRYFRSRADYFVDGFGFLQPRQHARGAACRRHGYVAGHPPARAASLAGGGRLRSGCARFL
jgi:hypothetical protein